ncbi:MAG: hypothetical protein EKK55_05215 [Rhodocyclaceae bacterium]|nr:MAG: hypothetical protein EKK55_05215 [Rhodocyclaceae bacterium]
MTPEGLPQVLSYGGGLDSFALLVGAVRRDMAPDVVAFCDVADPGEVDPGEWPSTYRHLREVVIPFCAAHGIAFEWVDTERYPVRGAPSLFAWLRDRKQIPVAGPGRLCTVIAKVERFERWLSDRFPGREVEVWVGFEAGEEGRAATDPNAGSRRRPKPGQAVRRNRFPLMEWGWCRCRCEDFIRALGLPVPRKSACVFCPYASKGDWQTLARELPARFASASALEAAKPPTSRGKKLSIMGYRTRPDGSYRAPPLPVFIEGRYRPRAQACGVCGRAQRATKATGCDYLPEGAMIAVS